MATTVELATAYVTLAIESSHIPKQIGGIFKGAEATAATSGKKMGQAISKGIESAKPGDVTKLQDDIVQGQKKLDTAIELGAKKVEAANSKVEIAEEKLGQARDNQILALRRIETAEDNLAGVREQASGRARLAEKKLQDLRADESATSQQIMSAENALTDVRLDNSRKVSAAEEGLAKARNAALDNTGVLNAERNLKKARDDASLASQKAEASQRGYEESLGKAKTALSEAEAENKRLESATEDAGASATRTGSKFGAIGQAFKSAVKGDFSGAYASIKGDGAAAADAVETEFKQAGDQGGAAVETGIGSVLTKIPALVAAAGISTSIAAAVGTGFENARLNDKLSAQLDLTGPQSEVAGKVAGGLYGNAYGESMEGVNEAVGAVMSSMSGMRDSSAEDLDRITGYALNLSDAFGVDVNEAVGSAGVLMKNGLASDADEAFDLITGSIQKMPAGFRDELFPAITEYGKHFQGLGIGGEEAMNMLVRGSENGTIGIDKMGDAVKEFQIRSTDMSESTKDAYAAIGVDSDDMTSKLLQGGETANQAFGEIIHGLQGMDDPQAQSQAALALFGTQLEDLGVNEIPNFLGILDPAGDKLDSLAGSAEEMGNTLRDNASTNIESFKRALGQSFTQAVGGTLGVLFDVGKFLKDTLPIWGPAAAGVAILAGAFAVWSFSASIAAGATTLLAGATTFLTSALAFLTSPIGLIVAGIALLVAGVIYAYNNFEWFRNAVQFVWEWIKSVVAGFVNWWTSTAWPAIANGLQVVGGWFTWLYQNVILPVWSAIQTAISWAWNTIIKPVFSAIWGFIVNTLGPIFNWLYHSIILPVWNFISAAISFAWNSIIKPIFAGIQWFIVNILAPVFRWLYYNVVLPVWNLIKWAIQTAWTIIKNVFMAIQWVLQNVVGPVIVWLYNNIVAPYFRAIGNIIKWVWDWVIKPVWNALKWFIENVLGPVFKWLYDVIIKPVWDWIGDKISKTVNWVRDTVLDPLGRWLKDTFVKAWESTKDGVADAWDKLRDAVKKPIQFVIDKVVNPFITGFNNLNDIWNGDDLKPLKVEGFARGGVIPGYQAQKRDDVMTPMRRGEGVLVPEAVRGLGADFIHGANAAGNAGGASAVRSWAAKGYSDAGMAAGSPSCAHGTCAHGPHGGPGGGAGGAAAGGGPVERGIWGPKQARMSQTGRVYINPQTVLGINAEKVAQAWQGRSALDIRVGDGEPNLKFVTGSSGPWGYYDAGVQGGTPVQINPAGPPNARSKQATAIHEIGHALSFHHAASNASIMYPMISNMMWTGPLDWAAAANVWGRPGENVKTYGDDGGAGGGGGGFVGMIRDYIKDKVQGKIDEAKKQFAGNSFVELPLGVANKAFDGIVDWVAEKFGGGSEDPGGEGVERWRSMVRKALEHTGNGSSEALVSGWLRQIQTESGGDPRAVQGNIGDVNNQTGDLAKGLVQVIGTTFAAYRDKTLPNDRFDPFANLVAGMNWASYRWGKGDAMLRQIGNGSGYAHGGIVGGRTSRAAGAMFASAAGRKFAPTLLDAGGKIQPNSGVQLIDHQRSTPDYVLTDRQWEAVYDTSTAVAEGATGQTINVTVPERTGEDPTTTGRRVAETTAFHLAKGLRA